jgi:hypothetical protein
MQRNAVPLLESAFAREVIIDIIVVPVVGEHP